MCAVNGVTWEDLDVVKEMCKANISRGPDLTRFHVNSNLSLGHNLLAINCQDLSVAAQPRKSEAGSLLAYNGQLYDVDAEEELDTEFLHRNLEKHGTKFLRHINGAFAFAWLQGDVLHLVRDHFGCRPMFYATCEKGLIFSSTIGSKSSTVHEPSKSIKVIVPKYFPMLEIDLLCWFPN